MVSFHKKEFSLFSAWIFSLIIISIGYYPLINDRLYLVDDITRSIKGYFGWIELGRPLTEWLAMFLSTSSDRLADITPLPQLSSIVALSYLTILLLKNTFHKITIGNVLICITVAVNPLLLGNMLFRFDSLSMILSMLLPVLAWDLLNKNRTIYALASLIACLSFYQPAIAIFPILVITTFIQSKKHNNKNIEYIIKSAGLTVVSCVLYYFVVVLNTIKSTEKRADLTTGLASNIYIGIKTSISTALQSYGHVAAILIAVATLAFIIVYAKHIIVVVKEGAGNSRFLNLSLMVFAPVVILICSAGVNLILSNGYYPTRVLFPIAFIVFLALAIPATFNDFFNR
ncbi:TPA: glucosyltransferase domain-containing protein, partial [Enterobacter hormaechei subsp. steigerwaltii]|nr:glucosyltransferase domain-containing protein [Enterobacter hormaechei subsp. steigerwaltii]HBK4820283.1 glucosyltransferase domain-containing protein [Enterobacter hormaechei subsp. steigerwaltii]